MIKFLCCAECSVHGYINSYLVMLLQEIFISMSCSHWDIFFLHQTMNLLARQSSATLYIDVRGELFFTILCNITSLFMM